MLINKKIFYKFRYLIAAISGILMALPLVYSSLGILQWIAFIPTAITLYFLADDISVKLRKLYLLGFTYFMPYFVIVFHWFYYMHPMDFAGLSGVESIFVVTLACFGMALLQAAASSFIFPLFAWLARGAIARKYQLIKPFLLASMFTVSEWAQTIGWWGVPWGRLCLGQIDYSVVIQPASSLGSYFVSFVLILVNLLIAYTLLNMPLAKLASYICIGVVVFQFAFGGVLLYVHSQNEGNESVCVSAAQDTVTNEEKWGDELPEYNYLYTISTYEKLTEEAAAAGAEIVVWPETVLPYEFFRNDFGMVYDMSRIAKENNVTILFSTFTYVDGHRSNGLYNSIIQVNPDGSYGESIYAKQHLVPFGEFLPMSNIIEPLLPALAELAQTDNIKPGEDSVVLPTESGNVGGLICFDSIYEELALDSVRNGAEIFVVSTNDAWFGGAAYNMHLSQSRLRAIECGRYVVRSANTGISAVISPTGEILSQVDDGDKGNATSEAYLRDNRTLYSIIGNTFVYVLIAFIGLVIVLSIIKFFKNLSAKIKAVDKNLNLKKS